MFTADTYPIKKASMELRDNIANIKSYMEENRFTTSTEDEVKGAEYYIKHLLELEQMVELAKMQAPSYLEVAKRKHGLYNQSFYTAKRQAELHISKGTRHIYVGAGTGYKNRAVIEFNLTITTVDGVQHSSLSDHLFWSERGQKKDTTEQFIQIAIKHGVLEEDIKIVDTTKE